MGLGQRSNAQVRSAMFASATSWARSRRRNARPSRPTRSAAACSGNDATARSSGPVVPSATRGDAAVPATNASSTDASGVASPADANTVLSSSSALQSAENSRWVWLTSVSCSSPTLVDAHRVFADSSASRRGVGEVVDGANLFDARAVDLFDLAHEQVEGDLLAQQDRELVDRDVVAAFEHVDADDVAVDGTDA